jgi:hypothetical protein
VGRRSSSRRAGGTYGIVWRISQTFPAKSLIFEERAPVRAPATRPPLLRPPSGRWVGVGGKNRMFAIRASSCLLRPCLALKTLSPCTCTLYTQRLAPLDPTHDHLVVPAQSVTPALETTRKTATPAQTVKRGSESASFDARTDSRRGRALNSALQGAPY